MGVKVKHKPKWEEPKNQHRQQQKTLMAVVTPSPLIENKVMSFGPPKSSGFRTRKPFVNSVHRAVHEGILKLYHAKCEDKRTKVRLGGSGNELTSQRNQLNV